MQRASPSEDHSAVRGRLRAIGLMCVALVLFSALDATAKYLISRDHIPVGEVVWLRFLGQTVYMVAIFHAFALPALLKTVQLKAQLFRSCLMLGTTAFNFLAVKYLRLDQTITIVFLTPLVVALLAGPVLGEWVGWRRMVAILVGFCGILIAVRPGVASIHPAIGYSVLSMLAYAGFMLVTRRIAAFDPPFVTLFYSMLAGTAGMAPHAIVEWVTPDSVVVGCGWRRSVRRWHRPLPVHPSLPPRARLHRGTVSLLSAHRHGDPRLRRLRRRTQPLATRWCADRRRLRRLPVSSRANDARRLGLRRSEASSHAADAVLTRLVVGGRRRGHDVG